jgi:hypothetical protein
MHSITEIRKYKQMRKPARISKAELRHGIIISKDSPYGREVHLRRLVST